MLSLCQVEDLFNEVNDVVLDRGNRANTNKQPSGSHESLAKKKILKAIITHQCGDDAVYSNCFIISEIIT
jgi:hypothetical protein